MIPITVKEIAEATNGKYFIKDEKRTVSGFFTDSRKANENAAFVALPGEKTDGHIFVKELVSRGYICLVSDEEYHIPGTVLVCDTKRAVYDIAVFYRNNKIPMTKVIAVTGSVGKTTVKDMIKLIFASTYKTVGTEGNSNSLLGVPISLMNAESDTEYAILELGMSERGEIARLSSLVKPFVSAITVIGTSHMEQLGSRENIRKEKFDILTGEAEGGTVVLSGDSEYEYSVKGKTGYNEIYFGTENRESDFFAEDIKIHDGKTEYTLDYKGVKTHIFLQTEGIHNVRNSLCAYAVGIMCGVSHENAAKALHEFLPSGVRQRVYNAENGVTVIADCYNASPESMSAAFDVIKNHTGRHISVLGDMLELGVDSAEIHRKNALKAEAVSDIMIFVGDYAGICGDAVRKSGKEVFVFGYSAEEKLKCASLLKDILHEGDTVLFKASRRIKLEDVIKESGL